MTNTSVENQKIAYKAVAHANEGDWALLSQRLHALEGWCSRVRATQSQDDLMGAIAAAKNLITECEMLARAAVR